MIIRERVQKIAQEKWNEIKDIKGFTKEDAVIYAMEVIDGYGYDYDPTVDEYQDLILNLVGESAYPEYNKIPEIFLVQKNIDGDIIPRIMNGNELIRYINMSDCHDENYEIFDCTSEFGVIKKLHYKGWQPNCLIEVVDEDDKVVLRGYGEDH